MSSTFRKTMLHTAVLAALALSALPVAAQISVTPDGTVRSHPANHSWRWETFVVSNTGNDEETLDLWCNGTNPQITDCWTDAQVVVQANDYELVTVFFSTGDAGEGAWVELVAQGDDSEDLDDGWYWIDVTSGFFAGNYDHPVAASQFRTFGMPAPMIEQHAYQREERVWAGRKRAYFA
jgi:hypothetical protein